MRFLSLAEVVELHRRIVASSGGGTGIRDLGALESAVAQPRMTFDGVDLYQGLSAKAAAMGYALIQNHPFVDGNKRVGHAAMEVFLILNDHELAATVDDGESAVLAVASGSMDRAAFTEWVDGHLVPAGDA